MQLSATQCLTASSSSEEHGQELGLLQGRQRSVKVPGRAWKEAQDMFGQWKEADSNMEEDQYKNKKNWHTGRKVLIFTMSEQIPETIVIHWHQIGNVSVCPQETPLGPQSLNPVYLLEE